MTSHTTKKMRTDRSGSNGLEKKFVTLQARLNTMSVLVSRLGLSHTLNQQTFESARHIYEALGYPLKLTFNDYFARYDRQDIAKAIIDRPVKLTWQGDVKIVESEEVDSTMFESQWNVLVKKFGLKSIFSRLDKLTGLGRYGVLFLGLGDVQTPEQLTQPAKKGAKLLYLKPLSEDSADVVQYESNTASERFGKPLIYNINIQESSDGTSKSIQVHHTRVMHVVDDILESDIEGTPRLKNIFNRLIDLEKIIGGDAEMFWKGARPGYQGVVDPNFKITQELIDRLEQEIDEYEHNLRRFLVNKGIKYESLAQQVADPLHHVEVQIQMISAATGIPKRILLGSERGELSSRQDADEWKVYVQNRREDYAQVAIIRPFIDICIKLGILPPPQTDGYSVEWSDLFSISDKERAEVAKLRTEALKLYSESGVISGIMPFEAFLRFFMGMKEDHITMIQDMIDTEMMQETQEAPTGEELEIIETEQVNENETVEE